MATPKLTRSATPASAARLRAALDRALVVVGARRVVLAGYACASSTRRRAVPAADVGDQRAGPQLLLDPVERGDPGRHQVRRVPGPEEPLAAVEDVRVLLVPAHAGAGAERLLDPRLGPQRAERELERAGQEDRPVRVGQREGLLVGQRVAVGARVVLDVAAGGLPAQPLGDVAGCRCRCARPARSRSPGRRRGRGRARAGRRARRRRRRRSRRGRRRSGRGTRSACPGRRSSVPSFLARLPAASAAPLRGRCNTDCNGPRDAAADRTGRGAPCGRGSRTSRGTWTATG